MAAKTDTTAMANRLSGKTTRVMIMPAENGFIVEHDRDSGPGGEYMPPMKTVFPDLEGVKGHLDAHLPTKGKSGSKRKTKVIDTGKRGTKKVRVVNVGPMSTHK